jgi:hypothetical protein
MRLSIRRIVRAKSVMARPFLLFLRWACICLRATALRWISCWIHFCTRSGERWVMDKDGHGRSALSMDRVGLPKYSRPLRPGHAGGADRHSGIFNSLVDKALSLQVCADRYFKNGDWEVVCEALRVRSNFTSICMWSNFGSDHLSGKRTCRKHFDW